MKNIITHAYVLAGGHSRRFGTDKARAPWGQTTLLGHLADSLTRCGLIVTAIAQRADQYADLGVKTLADIEADRGPVGGLSTALSDYRHLCETSGPRHAPEWILMTSCDTIHFDANWLTALQSKIGTDRWAILFEDTYVQPFPGLYHIDLLASIRRELERPNASLQHLIGQVRDRVTTIPADLTTPLRFANTPEELKKWSDTLGDRVQ